MNRSVEMISIKAAAAVLLCCVSALVTGCTASQFLSVADNSPALAAGMQGKVHGGQQPITGASVQLWAVGASGYGSAASKLGSSVASDSNGNFSLGAYTCVPNTLTYITASGGNPGLGSANPNIMLAAALGPCSSLSPSTFIFMDEVTTVATAFALGQYFDTTTNSFGAPNNTQAQVGIANAFATVNNLVTLATGTAVTSAALAGTPGTLTMTPESAKLNTVADILAACVNSTGGTSGDSSSCGKLFASSAPTGFTATDTLQAAIYMSRNPASNNASGSATNLATLFGLVTGSAPFVGVSSQPTDWTIGIKYTDTAATPTFFPKPQNVAVDGTGNVWVLNNNGGLGALVELSPVGVMMAAPTSLNVLSGGAQTPFLYTTVTTTPRNLAIDTGNNVWFTHSSSSAADANNVKSNGSIFEYATNGTSFGYPTGKSAFGLAIDGSNNVFVGEQSTTAAVELYEFPGGDLTKPVTYPIASATPGTAGTSGTNTFIAPEYMAFAPSGDLWMTGGVAASNFTVALTNIAPASTIITGCAGTYPCALTTSVSSNTYTKYNLGSITGASGLSAGTSSMFIADAITGNSVSIVPYLTPTSETNVGSTTSFTLPKYVATDGAGNLWASNTNFTPTGSNPTPGGSISELSSTGAILSPITPDATVTNPGYVHAGLITNPTGNTVASIAVDPSGNVWEAGAGNNSVFELVGAAVPTVTPISLALKNGTVGQKP